MLKGRRGGDVIASLLAPCVTSAVNGEKEQPGSNNNHKKNPYGGQICIQKSHNQTTMESAMCGSSIFRDKAAFFFFLLCSTQGEYDLKS